jgi:integrase
VFVNLFGGRAGAAMTYPAVHQLIGRIAARTGISFTAHMLRHSHTTDMEGRGVASDATFGTSREHALPAAQRATLQCPRPADRAARLQ